MLGQRSETTQVREQYSDFFLFRTVGQLGVFAENLKRARAQGFVQGKRFAKLALAGLLV